MPITRYATSGGLNIAYQVLGEAPRDLLLAPGFVSHLEWSWEEPSLARFLSRLASFSRLIMFDKRGTGLSDPVHDPPTYEQRMDDLRAVMDAAGSERAAVMGVSEGGALAALFAAAHPERTTALVLYGAYAKLAEAPDYPEGYPLDRIERYLRRIIDNWGEPGHLRLWAPSREDDARLSNWFAALERLGASPGMARKLLLSYPEVDVRSVLPAITAPTLVLHRRDDRQIRSLLGRYLARHIPAARFVELEGSDHLYYAGDADAIVDEIEEFLTGVRHGPDPSRRLATVMFIDVVGSTDLAARLGDRRWTETLASYNELTGRYVDRFQGRLVKRIGDGILATFDGPGRAINAANTIRDAVQGLGLDVRAGLHAGEVEIMNDDIGGIAVHISARVTGESGPGEVLVSSTVKELVAGSGFAFRDRGVHALKGVPDDWRLFAVESSSRPAQRASQPVRAAGSDTFTAR